MEIRNGAFTPLKTKSVGLLSAHIKSAMYAPSKSGRASKKDLCEMEARLTAEIRAIREVISKEDSKLLNAQLARSRKLARSLEQVAAKTP